MKKALSVENLLNKKFKTIGLTGPFRALMGDIEVGASIFIWGPSSNGKTTFLMQLAKELSKYHRVSFNSFEEGTSKSLKIAAERVLHGKERIGFEPRMNLDELIEKMQRHKAPGTVILDSFQYVGFTKKRYIAFKEAVPQIKIYNSHASGKRPTGSAAEFARYDADVKIWVEGFKAFASSRYAEGDTTGEYTIYEEGAFKYWLQNDETPNV